MIEIGAAAIALGALGARLDLPTLVWMLSAIAFAAIAFGFFRSTQVIVAVVFILGCIALGACMISFTLEEVPREVFGNRAFDAVVVSTERELDKTILIVRDRVYNVRIRLTVRGGVEALPGDAVTVRGTVAEPKDFVTDTGRIFPYSAYLASKRILGVMHTATVVLVESGSWSITRVATNIRHAIADAFSVVVDFPVDGILAGMLVGYQGGIPQSVQDLFRNTGVLHVLVLSGYNITLLAGFLAILLRHSAFRIRIVLTIIMVVLLVLVSGAGVASVRAGIMGSIALLAGVLVRTYSPMRALVLASLIFFFVSPEMIFVDPGFHLSFLATWCMIWVIPKVNPWFRWIPETKYVSIRELVAMAVCIPVFMLPYTMYFSGVVPVATVPANIVLALLAPAIMMLGVVLSMVSWIAPLAGILGAIVSGIGTVLVHILEVLSRLPVWYTPPIAWWGVLGLYVVLGVLVFQGDITSYLAQLRNLLQQRPSSSDQGNL